MLLFLHFEKNKYIENFHKRHLYYKKTELPFDLRFLTLSQWFNIGNRSCADDTVRIDLLSVNSWSVCTEV